MKYIKTYELYKYDDSLNITSIDLYKKGLKVLPELPKTLISLECNQNFLKELPKLPNKLEHINCTDNEIQYLKDLPQSLKTMYFGFNEIKYIDKLPDGLVELYIHNNDLTYLPKLPSTLQDLGCGDNNLKRLPDLPDSIKWFCCHSNKWEEPIKKKYIDLIKPDNLPGTYSNKQIELFSSEEFQRKFLTETPDRFEDLSCCGITVNVVIRKEFSYLFEGENMGFFNLKEKE